MKAEVFLDALRRLPVAPLADLTGGGPSVILSPHPDDETLGTGGLIATALAAGERVEVVVLTDGSGSHPRSRAYPRHRLVAVRRAESARAAAHLGLPAGALTHLDLPDTRLPTSGAAFEAAVSRLRAIVERIGARTVLVTWGHDPHCDHEAAEAIARALRRLAPSVALWAYPIWGWHLDPGTEVDAPAPRGLRLDIAPHLDVKHAAIAAHASQMTDLIADDPEGFRFEARTLAPFLGRYETFFEVPG